MTELKVPDPDQAIWYGSKTADDDEYTSQGRSLFQFGSIVLAHSRLLLIAPSVLGVLAFLWVTLSPPTYASGAVFLAESGESSAAGLSGIASQFGISLPGQSGPSPQFYAELARTPRILRALADSLSITRDGATINLATAFEVEGDSPAVVREIVVGILGGMISPGVDAKTGAVRYSVSSDDPDLAFQIARAILGHMIAFNVESRRTRASAEREFVAERVSQSMRELREAEQRLAEFLQRNRLYQNDPELSLEQQRLARDVRIQEQVFTSLAQTLERASIESSRTTPTFSIVEEPTLPVLPQPKPRLLIAGVAMLVGAMFAILAIMLIEHLRALREEKPADYEEFITRSKRLISDLAWLRRRDQRPAGH